EQADIHLVLAGAIAEFPAGERAEHFEAHQWEPLAELAHQQVHHLVGGLRAEPQADDAGLPGCRLPGDAPGGLGGLQGLRASCEKAPPAGNERDAARGAAEQLHSDLLLELFDLLGSGGWEMWRRAAARRKFSSSATAAKASKWRSSTAPPSPPESSSALLSTDCFEYRIRAT